MKLTYTFEQPPDVTPVLHELDLAGRGWVTVLDEHGTPLLRMYTEDDGSLGLGIYGPLGDFLYAFTLTSGAPGQRWDVNLWP